MIKKQNIPIAMGQGLDQKTDPKQLQLGKYELLENTIFQKGGLLQKRNGYGSLPALPDATARYLTTFNGNLTAIGNTIKAYSDGSKTWRTKGSIESVDLSVLPLIRSNLNQTQVDTAISANNLVCTVFTEVGGATSPAYKYAVADAVTGQNVIAPTALTATGSPRVFALGNYFVIVYTNVAALNYIAISVNNLAVTTPANLSNTYTPATSVAFDAVVANNYLFVAWNGSDGGGAIRMTYIDSFLTQYNTVSFAGKIATIMSVSADTTQNTPVIYAAFHDSGTGDGYVLAVNTQLLTVLAPTKIISTTVVPNITSSAQNMVCTVFYETTNAYGYDSTVPSNFITYRTATQTGTLGTATVLARSVGLASKSFIIDESIYVMGAYSSPYQPSYFLFNSSGGVIAKLAYSNGGGYLTKGLPSVHVSDTEAAAGYLIKDLIQATNKTQDAASNTPVYSQTGINLAYFDLTTDGLNTSEIGGNLNLTGGMVWAYDGYSLSEQLFHLWPDSVEAKGASATGGLVQADTYSYVATYEWADNQGNVFRSAPSIPIEFSIVEVTGTFTGTTTSGSPIVTTVSSVAEIQIGQHVTGTGIPADTYVLSIDSASQITLTKNATASNVGTTLTNSEVTAATIYVPKLRLTYKTSNPVKIVLYRWSSAQQTFYQTTSILAPILNNQSGNSDYATITDTNADSAIIGNNILYTTGGVVENIGPPAASVLTLYKSRLWLVDAEDRNLLWFSKQVIEATPVEMSDLLTIFVAPTTSAAANTGPITALSALDDKLIIFKANAIYYITGTGPDNTGTNNDFSEPIFITSTVGCANQASIVFMPNGLMFQSEKGIWLLGRDLSTTYIGAAVEDFNQYEVKSSVNVPGVNQVRFTMSNGITLMYDYYFQQWGTFSGVPAISSCIYQGLHTYINVQGNPETGVAFQETPNVFLDGANPTLIGLTTGWINPAGLQGYLRSYCFYLLGQYVSPHKLAISIAYDYNSSPSQTVVITPDNFSPVYGNASPYGAGTPYGGALELEQWRVFLTRQRCMSFQISINEIYDATLGIKAGAGLTLSGLNILVGIKSGWNTVPAAHSIGGG